MGATHPVIVEKLAMAGSVEETMHDILHDAGHKRHGQPAELADGPGDGPTAEDAGPEDPAPANHDDPSLSGKEDPSLSGRDDASLSSAAGPSSPPPSDASGAKKRKPLNPWAAHAKRQKRRRSSSSSHASSPAPQTMQQRRELSRMHTLLQSLTLVTPDLIRSKAPRPPTPPESLNEDGAAAIVEAMVVDGMNGHVEGHVGQNEAMAPAVVVGAPVGSPKQRRVVRFAMDGDEE